MDPIWVRVASLVLTVITAWMGLAVIYLRLFIKSELLSLRSAIEDTVREEYATKEFVNEKFKQRRP